MIRALAVSGPISPAVVEKEASPTVANDQSGTEASVKTTRSWQPQGQGTHGCALSTAHVERAWGLYTAP